MVLRFIAIGSHIHRAFLADYLHEFAVAPNMRCKSNQNHRPVTPRRERADEDRQELGEDRQCLGHRAGELGGPALDCLTATLLPLRGYVKPRRKEKSSVQSYHR